jgi:hypothetical protein
LNIQFITTSDERKYNSLSNLGLLDFYGFYTKELSKKLTGFREFLTAGAPRMHCDVLRMCATFSGHIVRDWMLSNYPADTDM